eukprot:GILK01001469.1.p1 GENE.GILK01001469.1~~GILK01001469.1.p1  ORF type:complete len:351 (-),score=49.22 GILK01001469.1:156-1169(-)
MAEVRVIVLKEHAVGLPDAQRNFEMKTVPTPTCQDDHVLLRLLFVSVDPYLRGLIRAGGSGYQSGLPEGSPMLSGAVAKVIESKDAGFVEGDIVQGMLSWQEVQSVPAKGLRKVNPSLAPISTAVGILGMTGLSAYFGLIEVGQPKAGETLVVSAAAGAVGSAVGQIGKILGLRVVGIAGSDEKVALLTEKYGFDAVVNYKKPNLEENLRAACPQGIDVYFENVGGEIADIVFKLLNVKGRVAVCGSISDYNRTEVAMGPRMQTTIVAKRLRVEGFLVRDFAAKNGEAMQQLGAWVQSGQLKYDETIVEGFENLPSALISLFTSDHVGKLVVKTADM